MFNMSLASLGLVISILLITVLPHSLFKVVFSQYEKDMGTSNLSPLSLSFKIYFYFLVKINTRFTWASFRNNLSLANRISDGGLVTNDFIGIRAVKHDHIGVLTYFDSIISFDMHRFGTIGRN